MPHTLLLFFIINITMINGFNYHCDDRLALNLAEYLDQVRKQSNMEMIRLSMSYLFF